MFVDLTKKENKYSSPIEEEDDDDETKQKQNITQQQPKSRENIQIMVNH